jgi:hypothetical protein
MLTIRCKASLKLYIASQPRSLIALPQGPAYAAVKYLASTKALSLEAFALDPD